MLIEYLTQNALMLAWLVVFAVFGVLNLFGKCETPLIRQKLSGRNLKRLRACRAGSCFLFSVCYIPELIADFSANIPFRVAMMWVAFALLAAGVALRLAGNRHYYGTLFILKP